MYISLYQTTIFYRRSPVFIIKIFFSYIRKLITGIKKTTEFLVSETYFLIFEIVYSFIRTFITLY